MIPEQLAYWYWLNDVKGVGPVISKTLLDKFVTPYRVYTATKDEIINATGIRESLAENIDQYKKKFSFYVQLAERQMRIAEMLDGHILTSVDSPYSDLYKLQSKGTALPAVIHVLGNLDYLLTRKFAIVGTRNPSEEGRRRARDLSANLAQGGYADVGGLALGIDAAGHKGALDAGGTTTAVLGCGADVVYPPGNAELYKAIKQRGMIISEFPFGVRPAPENLRQRNRTIVALAEGVVVAECSMKSGAMIAARFTAQQRKPLFSFNYPKPIDNSGGDWLISKSLALELKDTSLSTLLEALDRYRVPEDAHVDKIFEEIWSKKPKSDSTKEPLKKSRTSKVTKTSAPKVRKSQTVMSLDAPKQDTANNLALEEPVQNRTKTPLFLKVGDAVIHPSFGKGTVSRIGKVADDYQITVKFSKKKERTFSLNLANLIKV